MHRVYNSLDDRLVGTDAARGYLNQAPVDSDSTVRATADEALTELLGVGNGDL